MKSKAVVSGVLAAVLIALGSPAAMATKGHLKDCVDHAVRGSGTVEHRQIMSHTFHCHPVKRTSLPEGRTRVDGVLTHEHFGKDDKVTFTFVIQNGKFVPESMKKDVKTGWGPSDILDGIKALLQEVPLPAPEMLTNKGIDLAIERAENLVVGKWEPAANQIIDLIAAKQAAAFRRNHRKP